MPREIDEIDPNEIDWEVWVDTRIPEWYSDPAVWRYLGQKYGLQPGGIIDDEEDKPPLLTFERTHSIK
jgi:hypothetical protein